MGINNVSSYQIVGYLVKVSRPETYFFRISNNLMSFCGPVIKFELKKNRVLWFETQSRPCVIPLYQPMIHSQFHSLCMCVCVLEEGRRAPDRQRGCIAAERQLVQSTRSSAAHNILRLSPFGWIFWTHFLQLYHLKMPTEEDLFSVWSSSYCHGQLAQRLTDV